MAPKLEKKGFCKNMSIKRVIQHKIGPHILHYIKPLISKYYMEDNRILLTGAKLNPDSVQTQMSRKRTGRKYNIKIQQTSMQNM